LEIDGAGAMSTDRRFEISFGAAAMADLLGRLRNTRWTDAVAPDWSYGTDLPFLQRLVRHWAEAYDWPARLAALNALPHRRMEIGGYGVHYLHFKPPGGGAPLLLMNGWPSSFVEYTRLGPLLAEGPEPFEVVIPALPGFGFSDRPTRPYQVEPADLFPALMSALGHERFLAAGTDIGSGVATRIALHHPERVTGIHISAVAPKPAAPGAPPPSAAELAYAARSEAWSRDEGGYQAIQSSRPQTLAVGLADSPAGLAAWIVDKFRAWSDCDGDVERVFPLDTLVDNLMVYWITGTIGSSVRYYYEASRLRPPLRADDFVAAPTALAVWPHDLAQPPRGLAERLYNIRRYTVMPRGGHFPAWEAPELYAADLRAFAGDI
jgi:microsomal epoxide hydrolase